MDELNTKWLDDEESCLTLSITNLSSLDNVRKAIVENWIKNDPNSVKDKDIKIEEIKTNVIFKLYKGMEIENLIINSEKINIFHINNLD